MKTKTNISDPISMRTQAMEANFASLCFDEKEYSLLCLTSIEEIQAIECGWANLERNNSGGFSYFQSFDWCYQWCLTKFEHDSKDRDSALRIFILRHKDEIVMIWPMMELKTRIGAKILTSLTDPLAQYSNVLVDRKHVSEDAGREIWNLICKQTKVDAITFDRYPSGSFLDAILCDVGFAEKSFNEASILDLTEFDTWENHHASLSRNQRKQRNRRKSKLGKLGELTYEVSYGGSRKFPELVGLALKMKQDWLKNTGRRSDILAQSDTMNFLTNLSGNERGPGGYAEGAVSQVLCVNGAPIAVEIGMVMERHYYSYLGAFDWAWKEYSPGNIQIEAAQKWAKSAGLEKFDFLGDPADYKEQWTGSAHLMHSRSVPKTALGFLYCAIWKSRLRPQLKNVYKNMGADRRKISWKVMQLTLR